MSETFGSQEKLASSSDPNSEIKEIENDTNDTDR